MNEAATVSELPALSRRATVRLTTAQALVRYLAGLRVRLESPDGGEIVPLFGGVFAIFRPRKCCRPWRGSLPI
jgi:3D-(3,5/4)-trihydroxycyclohexane-1,2-dione acylhydrolase (decyclizing)